MVEFGLLLVCVSLLLCLCRQKQRNGFSIDEKRKKRVFSYFFTFDVFSRLKLQIVEILSCREGLTNFSFGTVLILRALLADLITGLLNSFAGRGRQGDAPI